jgi:GNAT superfamily N-acetyltransferase
MSHEDSADSVQIHLTPLGTSDEALVDQMLDGLTAYSMAAEGAPKMTNGARRFLTDLPPRKDPSSKHAFAVLANNQPVGLIDLIDRFPREEIAFVGLLAIIEGHHGEGFGRSAYSSLENFARNRLGASTMRLAVVEDNPARTFWRRMGFEEIGEVRLYNG